MILDKEIEIIGHSRNIDHYKKMGYEITVRKPILVKVCHLMPGASNIVKCKCSVCKEDYTKPYKEYYICTDKLSAPYFCNGCKGEKIKYSNLKKYGVENVMYLESSKETMSKNNLEKYGVEHFYQSDNFKDKYKNIMQQRYGVDNSFQADEVKDKIRESNLRKHGVEYPQQSSTILSKSNITNLEKYGVLRPLQSKTILNKMYYNNYTKHGVNNTFCLADSVINRQKSTFKTFDTNYYFQSKIFIDSNNKYTIDKFVELLEGTNINIISYTKKLFVCQHDDHTFTTNYQLLYERVKDNLPVCVICNPICSGVSLKEKQIGDFMSVNNINFETQNKSLLNGRHLDFYVPSHNLAIEFNGVYWHSELYKSEKYHLDKTHRCSEMGITLLHIFEDDWIYKQSIIKSIILNKLNLVSNKIYARKCIIKQVSAKDSNKFLTDNHIQGSCKSTYKFGLYHNNELVSLMTFGYRKTNAKKEFELVRFCNKINTNVIGASSKLFKYAINTMEFEYMISYSDLSLFDGGMYEMLGFKRKHLSKPNYFWVVDGVRQHRWKYNKQNLIKEGFDGSKTEVKIMHERGYYRIWGCGQVRWEYTKKEIFIL